MSAREHDEALEHLIRTSPDDIEKHSGAPESECASDQKSVPQHHRLGCLHTFIYAGLLALTCCIAYLCGLRIILAKHPVHSTAALASILDRCKWFRRSLSATTDHSALAPAYAAIKSMPNVVVPELHIGPENPYSGAPTAQSNELWKTLLKGKLFCKQSTLHLEAELKSIEFRLQHTCT